MPIHTKRKKVGVKAKKIREWTKISKKLFAFASAFSWCELALRRVRACADSKVLSSNVIVHWSTSHPLYCRRLWSRWRTGADGWRVSMYAVHEGIRARGSTEPDVRGVLRPPVHHTRGRPSQPEPSRQCSRGLCRPWVKQSLFLGDLFTLE